MNNVSSWESCLAGQIFHQRAVFLGVSLGFLVVSLLLAKAADHPGLGTRFPRLAAWAWPYIPMGFLLLVMVAGVSTALPLIRCFRPHLREEIESTLSTSLGVLWPWLPILFGVLVVGYMLARHLTRRTFHLVFLGSLVFGIVTVVYRPISTPVPCVGPDCREAAENLPVPPPITALFDTSQGWVPPWLFSLEGFHSQQVQFSPCRLTPVSDWQMCVAKASPPRQASHVLADRMSARVVTPLLDEQAQLDRLTLFLLGGGLLVLYFGLSRLNARGDTAPLSVGRLENEKKEPQPHLERLMMECLNRSSPHAPPRFPGGAPVYWRQLAENLSEQKEDWKVWLAGVLMRIFSPSRELQVHGTVSEVTVSEVKANEDAGGTQTRLSIELRELPSQRTLMSRTFDGKDPQDVTTRAAYAVAERALLMHRWMPEWGLWREEDGSALRSYWSGVEKLREIDKARYPRHEQKLLKAAAEEFRQAARRSNGNALARLQLAEVLEAQQCFVEALKIYLDLVERYPRMLAAIYRLAAILGTPAFWYRQVAETPEQWDALKLVLERCSLLEGAREPFPPMRTSDLDIQLYFNRLCEYCLRRLIQIADLRALWWSVKDPGDRRCFKETLLWPPRKRIAYLRTVSIALTGAEIRRWRLEWRKAHDAGDQSRQLYVHEEIQRLITRVDSYSVEAMRSVDKARGLAWGQVHYNLACLYALNMENPHNPLNDALPSKAQRVSLEEKAVRHLYYCLRDPTGPMASGAIWWVFKDRKLEVLRGRNSFAEWERIALAQRDTRRSLALARSLQRWWLGVLSGTHRATA